jgi:hypothetical protein
LDTDNPEDNNKLQGGAKMNIQNAPLSSPQMDTSNAKGLGYIPTEASTKPSPIVPDTKMRNLPTYETPKRSGAMDRPNVPQSVDPLRAKNEAAVKTGDNEASAKTAGYPVETTAPDPMDIIQQDKIAAMKKGPAGLSDLGTAMIHENLLNAGKPRPEQMPTKEFTPEDEAKQQKEALHQKMLYAPTEQERFQAEKDLAELKRRTPWGSPENHPGALGKIGHVLGNIGQAALMGTAPYALPMIPGSQASIAGQEARGEQGVEQAQGKELKEAQIAEAQAKPELQKSAQALTAEKTKATEEAALRKQGYTMGPEGKPVPIPYEEMSQHEQGVYDLNQAKANAQDAIAQLKKAQADPSSPQNQAIIAKAKDEAKKLDLAGQKLGLDVDKYKADYLGVDHDGNPLPGVQTTEAGKPVGTKVSKAEQTTTSMRLNKADLSQNVQLNAANAAKLIDANPDLFGKVSGRFTNVREMAGTNDPAIMQLGIQVHNMAVASAGIHGQRGQAAVEAYEKDILNRFRNSPEVTKAALTELSGSVQTFIDDARAGKKVAPTPKTEEEVKTGIPKDATHVYKNKEGRIMGYAQGGKYHEIK